MDPIGITLLHRLLLSKESEWERIVDEAAVPRPAGSFRGSHYATALGLIRGHAGRRYSDDDLREQAAQLRTRADREGDRKGARWMHNARVVEDYLEFSVGRLRVLPRKKLILTVDEVSFGVVPDIHATADQRQKVFKFHCPAKSPGKRDKERYELIAQLMYEAVRQAQLPISPEDVRIIDLHQRTALPGARARSGLQDDLRRVAKRIKELRRRRPSASDRPT